MYGINFLKLVVNKNFQFVNFIIIYEQCILNVLKIFIELELIFYFYKCFYINIIFIWILKIK